MKEKAQIAVVGASGYAGAEIVRLLGFHPNMTVGHVTSARSPGFKLSDLCPWLATDLVLEPFHCEIEADAFFLCQKAGFAGEVAQSLAKDAKVVDLSADFRLADKEAYETLYEKPWPGSAVYGLPELVGRSLVSAAGLVANPGCHATASLLGLMPLVRAGLVDGTPVIDSKTGVSGAGRSRQEPEYMFSELDNGSKPYAVIGHRHIPEIEAMAGISVRFTPHLLPIARGLEATLQVPVRGVDSSEGLRDAFEKAYANEPFIRFVTEPPSTKMALGSNACILSAVYDPHTRFAVVTTVIDNLGKGAAGQAIQNMNLMLGLPETAGLTGNGVWP